jgi:hypothetical protein
VLEEFTKQSPKCPDCALVFRQLLVVRMGGQMSSGEERPSDIIPAIPPDDQPRLKSEQGATTSRRVEPIQVRTSGPEADGVDKHRWPRTDLASQFIELGIMNLLARRRSTSFSYDHVPCQQKQ